MSKRKTKWLVLALFAAVLCAVGYAVNDWMAPENAAARHLERLGWTASGSPHEAVEVERLALPEEAARTVLKFDLEEVLFPDSGDPEQHLLAYVLMDGREVRSCYLYWLGTLRPDFLAALGVETSESFTPMLRPEYYCPGQWSPEQVREHYFALAAG